MSLAARPSNTAPLIDGTYVIRSTNAARQVLDVTYGSTKGGANVETWNSNGGSNQKWTIERQSDGSYTLRSLCSGLLLDLANASAKAGANVIQWASNGGANQRWILSENGEGWTITSALSPNLVLDVANAKRSNGANVLVWTPNGGANQCWELIPATADVAPGESIDEGYYRITAPNGASVIDVANESTSEGGTVGLWKANGGANQYFQIAPENGYVRIQNGNTGLYVTMNGSDYVAGSDVTQHRKTSDGSQLFSIEKVDGGYAFRNVANGLYLSSSSYASGAGVKSGNDARAFVLDPATHILDDGLFQIIPQHARTQRLDVVYKSIVPGASVIQWGSNEGFNQKWDIVPVDGAVNTYTIQSVNSGLFLSDSNGNAVQSDGKGATAQWIPIPMSNGYVLKNAATGLVLDIANKKTTAGANVCTWNANGGANQRFKFAVTSPVPNGLYEIQFASDTEQLLDVANKSTSSGGNVVSWANNGGTNQVWAVSRNADGTYAIVNYRSGKALEAADGGTTSGSNIYQANRSSSNAQRWRIEYMHDGSFRIVSSSNSSIVLGTSGAAVSNGDNVVMVAGSDASARNVRFTSAPGKRGWQNPAKYPQVSRFNVKLPSYAHGFVMPSRISADATREECVETLIAVAYEYKAAGSWWVDNTIDAPGGPIDCSGMILEGLYACGMSLDGVRGGDYNPTTKATTKPYFSNEWRIYGTFMPVSSPRRGDIVYYDGHVGIYLGGGKMIDSWPGTVSEHNVNNPQYGPVLGYGRPFV